MNTEALIKTRDFLAGSNSYDQEIYAYADGGRDFACGTPACVAGHAVAANGWVIVDAVYAVLHGNKCFIPNIAEEVLGLTPEEADAMFQEDPMGESHDTSKEEALAMLDHAIETGEVKWEKQDEC